MGRLSDAGLGALLSGVPDHVGAWIKLRKLGRREG